eukprot:PhF_6_TR4531/c1_g1_i1/m.6358
MSEATTKTRCLHPFTSCANQTTQTKHPTPSNYSWSTALTSTHLAKSFDTMKLKSQARHVTIHAMKITNALSDAYLNGSHHYIWQYKQRTNGWPSYCECGGHDWISPGLKATLEVADFMVAVNP